MVLEILGQLETYVEIAGAHIRSGQLSLHWMSICWTSLVSKNYIARAQQLFSSGKYECRGGGPQLPDQFDQSTGM